MHQITCKPGHKWLFWMQVWLVHLIILACDFAKNWHCCLVCKCFVLVKCCLWTSISFQKFHLFNVAFLKGWIFTNRWNRAPRKNIATIGKQTSSCITLLGGGKKWIKLLFLLWTLRVFHRGPLLPCSLPKLPYLPMFPQIFLIFFPV